MIYLECKANQTLVQVLIQLPRREIVHELKGKYEVAKRIGSARNALGMVDEDPGQDQPPYLTTMRVLRDMRDRGLKVLQDASRSNRVVILCPTLEEWIIGAAREARLDLRSYNLPDTASSLHRVINQDLRRFERLAQGLADTPRLISLRQELE